MVKEKICKEKTNVYSLQNKVQHKKNRKDQLNFKITKNQNF